MGNLVSRQEKYVMSDSSCSAESDRVGWRRQPKEHFAILVAIYFLWTCLPERINAQSPAPASRLEDEQQAFMEFLERLRHDKDKAEFDQFMAERRNNTYGSNDGDPSDRPSPAKPTS